MVKKVTKASKVLEMLNKGMSIKEITNKMAVSYGYVWNLKNRMAHAADDVLDLTEDMKETLHQITSGRKGRRAKPKPTHQFIEIPEEVTRELSGLLNAKPGEYIEVEGQVGPNEIDTILDQRGSRYGNFLDHARITQKLKSIAHQFAGERGKTFDADQAEALDMIFHKIGRILNGDPDYADSWIDIAGYAKLVADRLEGKVR